MTDNPNEFFIDSDDWDAGIPPGGWTLMKVIAQCHLRWPEANVLTEIKIDYAGCGSHQVRITYSPGTDTGVG